VLRTRLWTAAVALPAVVAAVIFSPNWFFTLFIAVLGAWGLYEIAGMTAARTPLAIAPLVAAGAAPLLALLYGGDATWLVPAAVILVMFALVGRVAASGGERGPKGAVLTLIGAAWVGFLFPYFALLRNLDGGIPIIILMLLLVVASDTGAYFGGTYLGRLKLAPRVSPHKTVEGSVTGLVASVVVAILLRPWLAPAWNGGATAAVGAVIAMLAQLGDLAGSAFKRSAGVKDSGWIFPGHGGLLDRTCSLVFACVFTYYYCK
jgi:phosphatidate cytidylyltransferase